MNFMDLSQNQIRTAIDAKQTYEAFRDSKKHREQYNGGMSWKTVSGKDYLIKIINRTGGNKSLGPRSPETELIYSSFILGKEKAASRLKSISDSVAELSGMSVGVGINRVPSIVTSTLRRLDDFGVLGKNIIVIGTNAMYGYESVAGVMFDSGMLATTDIDLLWDSRTTLKLANYDEDVEESGILAILRKVDKSFEPVIGRQFRAVNKSGFYVDLVKQTPFPPWKKDEADKIAASDLTPAWLPNIKWLLSSEKFKSTVIGHDGFPAPMVSPDPRAFAIYKIWLSQQPDREPEKKSRDKMQAMAVADLVYEKFQHLKFDSDSARIFPSTNRNDFKRNSL